METSKVLLGLLYVLLGLAFLFSRGRFAGRNRGLALIWLFMGVLLTANGALKVLQGLG
jgi:hypothetical protein